MKGVVCVRLHHHRKDILLTSRTFTVQVKLLRQFLFVSIKLNKTIFFLFFCFQGGDWCYAKTIWGKLSRAVCLDGSDFTGCIMGTSPATAPVESHIQIRAPLKRLSVF